MHPFTLCFYIKFSSHSFNYDNFGLESFIEIWSLFFWLLFLVVPILFLIEIIFQFHPLWFVFLCVLNLVLFLFKSIFFLIMFFQFIFSCLSLIILVGLEFYVVIFFWVCLLLCDPTSWFVLQFLKVGPGSLQLILIIFRNFIHHHWVRFKLIFLFFYILNSFVNLIFLFDFALQFNICLYLRFDMILLMSFDDLAWFFWCFVF